jgi:hypothetical protein
MAKDDGKAMKEAAQDASQVLGKIARQVEKAAKIAAIAIKNPAAGGDDLLTLLEDLADMVDDVKGCVKEVKAASK